MADLTSSVKMSTVFVYIGSRLGEMRGRSKRRTREVRSPNGKDDRKGFKAKASKERSTKKYQEDMQ